MHVGKKGFTLLETLIALGLTAIVVTGSLGVYLSLQTKNTQNEFMVNLEDFNRDLKTHLSNPASWRATVEENSSFDCLRGDNCKSPAQKFRVYYIDNTKSKRVFFDATNPQMGVSLNGIACGTFNPFTDDRDCPVGVDLTWQVICDGAYDPLDPSSKCQKPLVEIKGVYKKNQLTSLKNLNFKKLDFKYNMSVRDFFGVSDYLCLNFNGSMTPDGKCSVPVYNQSCTDGAFAGITTDANGQVKAECAPFRSTASVNCSDQADKGCNKPGVQCAVVGYSVDGGIICDVVKNGTFTQPKISDIKDRFTATLKTTTPNTSYTDSKLTNFTYDGKIGDDQIFKTTISHRVKSDSDGRSWWGRDKNSKTETYVTVELRIRVPKEKVKVDSYGNLLRGLEKYNFLDCKATDSRASANSGSCHNIKFVN